MDDLMNEQEFEETSEELNEVSEMPKAKKDESREEKFVRVGQYRMTKALDAIGRLENLSNKASYTYTQEQVDKMFGALEKRLADTKGKFSPSVAKEENSFTF